MIGSGPGAWVYPRRSGRTSDLAEIAAICALESGVKIVAVVDAKFTEPRFSAAPPCGPTTICPRLRCGHRHRSVQRRETAKQAIARCGADRVLVPDLLRIRISDGKQGAP